ncbi:mechanosensitive ion channel protein [Kordiimonas sediminis]|uniref:Small-conductance mechanosensitive channel n=1 Tax=Kordiimonas sediminis TaxID=1735581 RepID=A0A919ALV7_9PROT|nr:mechanosensitive ion channel domain-containing protein [Kordiimonas sediminis]GHF15098.1 mechanosensitive ion channel protein [Kordiimonas sediminis]
MQEEMQQNMQEMLDLVMATVTNYGMSVVGAIIILIIGFWIAGKVKNWIMAASVKSEKMDTTVGTFLASAAKYAIVGFTLVAVLEKFGVQTTSFVAVLGAMGLAVGLALQGTLGHLASGVMLLVFRPFKVGQFIDAAGHSGTIKAINLFTTEMDTADNIRIIIPNSSVWGASIKNFNYHDTRRVDMVFGIGYGDDINKAMAVIGDVLKADARTFDDPAPVIVVGNLGDSSVDITVRVWCATSDYWGVKFDTTKTVKEEFDKNGIEIPFPQRVMHSVS